MSPIIGKWNPAPTSNVFINEIANENEIGNTIGTASTGEEVAQESQVVDKKEPSGYPVTLTVTSDYQRVATETVTLGDDYPTATATGGAVAATTATTTTGQAYDTDSGNQATVQNPLLHQHKSSSSSSSSSHLLKSRFWNGESQTNGIPPASIAGIIIGVLGGVSLLFGVFYVYHLRALDLKQKKKRRKGRKRRASSAATDGEGPGPPPPPPPPAEDPPPEE